MSSLLVPTTRRPAPLAELRDWLADTATRLRTARIFGPLARVEVARDIARDCLSEQAAISTTATFAESSDRAALGLLDSVLSDGQVTPAEVRALRRARTLVSASALADHAIATRTTLPTP